MNIILVLTNLLDAAVRAKEELDTIIVTGVIDDTTGRVRDYLAAAIKATRE